MRQRCDQLKRLESQGIAIVNIENDFRVLRGILIPLVHSSTMTITVNYTFDNWISSDQSFVVMKRSRSGEFQQFSFNICWPRNEQDDAVILFSICVHQNGRKFVDDNGGMYYSIKRAVDSFDDVIQYYVPRVDVPEDPRLNGISPVDAVIIRDILNGLQGVKEKKILKVKRSHHDQLAKFKNSNSEDESRSTAAISFSAEPSRETKKIRLHKNYIDATEAFDGQINLRWTIPNKTKTILPTCGSDAATSTIIRREKLDKARQSREYLNKLVDDTITQIERDISPHKTSNDKLLQARKDFHASAKPVKKLSLFRKCLRIFSSPIRRIRRVLSINENRK